MRVYIILALFMVFVSSCETPEGGGSSYFPLHQNGANGETKTLRQEVSFGDNFGQSFGSNILRDGFAETVNAVVTPAYGSVDCHKVGLKYTVEPLEDATEIDQMIEAAFDSDNSCKTVFTGNAGNTSEAGLPYAKTFAYSMIQDLCNPEVGNIGKNLSMPSFGSKDALSLSHFNNDATNQSDPTNLATTYALMYSLGQRESDGNFKEGRDLSGNNKSAETIEAGLFQVSANSLNLGQGETTGFLKDIFRTFVTDLSEKSASQKGELCLTSKLRGTNETRSLASDNDLEALFKSGSCNGTKATVRRSRYRSSRVSTCFRELTKACPSFAIKYAAGVARVNRAHNGPLYTHAELRSRGLKSAKYRKPYPRPACHSVFQSILTNKSKICPVN